MKPQTRAAGLESLAGEYTCFLLDKEEYGIPTSGVTGIMEAPRIRQVPKSPDFVAGVANIRGRIVPVLDTAQRFGLSIPAAGDQRLLLIRFQEAPYGLLVRSISGLQKLWAERIEPVNPIMVKPEAPFITAMANLGDRTIQLIDIDAFLNAGLEVDRQTAAAYRTYSARLSETLQKSAGTGSHRYMALTVGEELYGVDLDSIGEVVPTETMKKKRGGPPYLAGVISARGRTIPVVDLQKKFDLEPAPYTEKSRVITLESQPYGFGIVANAVTEILSIAADEIKASPQVIAPGAGASHIQAVAMLEGGQRLAILLDTAHILAQKEIDALKKIKGIEIETETRQAKSAAGAAADAYLIFEIGAMEFAIQLNALAEVIPFQAPSPVPKAPTRVRGLLSIKGELVSVIDLRGQLGLPKAKPGVEKRMLVLRRGEDRYALAVDAVSEILRLPASDLAPSPKIIKGVDADCISKMIVLAKTDRTPMVLNLEAVLGAEAKAVKPKAMKKSRKRSGK